MPGEESRDRTRLVTYGGPVVAVIFWTLVVLWASTRTRESGRPYPRCASNLKQIGYACHLYMADHGETYPEGLGHFYPEYISDTRVFTCGRVGPKISADEHMTYCYVSGLTAADPAHYVLAFDEEWNHGGQGIYVLFVGSNVDWHRDIDRIHKQLEKQRMELAAQGRKMRIIRPAWSRWPERPEYPVPPLRERPFVVALVAGSGIAVAALAVLLLIRRRRRRARENRA